MFFNAVNPDGILVVVFTGIHHGIWDLSGWADSFEPADCMSMIRTDFNRPVPMLTTQNFFTLVQILCASDKASSAGLLCVSPPSTNLAPGRGISILIGLKN